MYKETDESHVTFIYYWIELLLNLYRNVNQPKVKRYFA